MLTPADGIRQTCIGRDFRANYQIISRQSFGVVLEKGHLWVRARPGMDTT